MAGTKEGGRKAHANLIIKYGLTTEGKSIFHIQAGKKGGKVSSGGGFASNPELARIAGAKGGKISRRKPTQAQEEIVL